MDELLIIFIKNPVTGKVKTRLGQVIGFEEAQRLYLKLLQELHFEVAGLCQNKVVFYDSFIDKDDIWENHLFYKSLQSGHNIGERMCNAFMKGFSDKYRKVILVGGDIIGLSSKIIGQGFDKLENHDIVLGPARDGGYYLIGMKKNQPELFDDIYWGSDLVLKQTLDICDDLDLKYSLLAELSDLDQVRDLKYLKPESYRKRINKEKKDFTDSG